MLQTHKSVNNVIEHECRRKKGTKRHLLLQDNSVKLSLKKNSKLKQESYVAKNCKHQKGVMVIKNASNTRPQKLLSLFIYHVAEFSEVA